MKRNIGLIDSFIRIALGLIILGCGIARKCTSSIIIGSMSTASGIVGFCPLIYLSKLKSTFTNSI